MLQHWIFLQGSKHFYKNVQNTMQETRIETFEYPLKLTLVFLWTHYMYWYFLLNNTDIWYKILMTRDNKSSLPGRLYWTIEELRVKQKS